MRNKLLILAIMAIGFATTANAQNSATNTDATASATIVTPVTITKVADLNFGSIVKSTAGGTVTLSPAGAVTATGVTMFSGSSAVQTAAAEFTVSGENGTTYEITMPADNAVVLADGSGNTMSVTSFTNNATGTFGAAPETFQVGATLNVGAAQVAGTYTSPAFAVTVAYN